MSENNAQKVTGQKWPEMILSSQEVVLRFNSSSEFQKKSAEKFRVWYLNVAGQTDHNFTVVARFFPANGPIALETSEKMIIDYPLKPFRFFDLSINATVYGRLWDFSSSRKRSVPA